MNFILVRGLTRAAIHWNFFEEYLKSSFPNAKIFYLELPGAGELASDHFPINDQVLMNDLKNQIIKMNLDDKAHLISISLGGMVALHLVNYFPDLFATLTIINSSLKQLSPFYKRMQLGFVKNTPQILLEKNLRQKEFKILKNTAFLQNDDRLHEVANFYADNAIPMSLANTFRQLFWAIKTKVKLSHIKLPVLILASKKDPLCHFSCSIELHKKIGGKIFFHESAGHDLPLDAPDWICDRIKENLL